MSKINVNTWEPESSTALTMGASGDTTTVPSGASLVVASGATINITGATQTGFPSGGFADVFSTVATSVVYTVPTDITKLLVIITGGGGGGAGGYDVIGNCGVGGAGGTTVMARVTVVPDDTITIAVGAAGTAGGEAAVGGVGGDSTFTWTSGSGSGSMSTITAPGGKFGKYEAATDALVAGTVGANNEGISILGGYGGRGYSHPSGSGGSSFWGGGGQGALMGDQASTDGTAYGSGGGGGSNANAQELGGAGAVGVCFIMEFK
tara:strand:- start:578 stop:1369 length:792 start_codon:yes stop_codon:yes gene_type:complete